MYCVHDSCDLHMCMQFYMEKIIKKIYFKFLVVICYLLNKTINLKKNETISIHLLFFKTHHETMLKKVHHGKKLMLPPKLLNFDLKEQTFYRIGT